MVTYRKCLWPAFNLSSLVVLFLCIELERWRTIPSVSSRVSRAFIVEQWRTSKCELQGLQGFYS